MEAFLYMIFVTSLHASGLIQLKPLGDFDDFMLLSSELFDEYEDLFEQYLKELSDLKRLIDRAKCVSRTVFLVCLLTATRSLAKRNIANPAAIYRLVQDEICKDPKLIGAFAAVREMRRNCARMYFKGGTIIHGGDVAELFEQLLNEQTRLTPLEQVDDDTDFADLI